MMARPRSLESTYWKRVDLTVSLLKWVCSLWSSSSVVGGSSCCLLISWNKVCEVIVILFHYTVGLFVRNKTVLKLTHTLNSAKVPIGAFVMILDVTVLLSTLLHDWFNLWTEVWSHHSHPTWWPAQGPLELPNQIQDGIVCLRLLSPFGPRLPPQDQTIWAVENYWML